MLPSGDSTAKSSEAPSLLLLGIAWMLAWSGMKISLPALPELEHVFHVSGDVMRATVTAFFICFAIGQFTWSILSDRIGRRIPLLIGMAIAAGGSIVVLLSESILTYTIGRCLEGVGLATISPLSRAILFETRSHDGARNAMRRILMCTAAVPLFAQVIGGYIVVYAGWRWIFAGFLAATILVLIAFAWRLPESLPPEERSRTIRASLRDLRTILTNRSFWAHALCYMACTGTLLGYYATMPFWYSKDIGIAIDNYPWLAAFTVVIYVISLSISRKLHERMQGHTLIFTGLAIAALPGIALLGMSGIQFGNTGLIVTLVGASMVFAIGTAFVFPGVIVGIAIPFPGFPGLASAVNITLVFLFAGVMTFLEGQLHATNLAMIGLLLLLPPLLAIPVFAILGRGDYVSPPC